MDATARREVQSGRLSQLVDRLRHLDAPYWAEKLGDHPGISSVDELESLPFTEKGEFRDTYPYDMLTVPLEDVVRIHASSGTSGKPTIVAYTAHDVAVFSEVVARCLSAAGASSEDVIQISYGYGLFTGGLGLHYGAEELGATAVPASGGNPGFQVNLMADAGVTGLACTPSFALVLAERAEAMGIWGDIGVRWGIHGAEPWSESLREKIEDAWGGNYDAIDIYGLSEVIGPGVGGECRENKGGLHIPDDHFLPEIVDPETGESVEEGERGELAPHQPHQASPTRDPIPHPRHNPVPARALQLRPHHADRIARIEGRADDMLIIRGINVYPRTIEEILMGDPQVGPNYAIIVDRRGRQAEVEARVEIAEEAPGGPA